MPCSSPPLAPCLPTLARAELGPWLAQQPAGEVLILTVNKRLARQLVIDLAAKLAHGQVTELPRIVPLARWVTEAADALALDAQATLPAHRLDAFAAHILWQQVITDCEAQRPLLDVALTAHLASEADLLIDEWQLAVPPAQATLEYQRLQHWRTAYHARLRALDAADANQEFATVLAALAAGQITVPPQVLLAGLGDVSPRLARLLAGFAAGGAQCRTLTEDATVQAQPQRWQAHDHPAEWQAATAWAAQQLCANPAGRYAIVAASLESDVVLARRLLACGLRDAQGAPLPFNVAVGRPLADWPAVRAALAWLHVWVSFACDANCPVATLGAALLAGHCAGDLSDAEHGSAHAMLDVQWRRRQQHALAHADWQQQLAACPALAAAWARACALRENMDEASGVDTRQASTPKTAHLAQNPINPINPAPPAVWVSRFRAVLAALGFPGERALDSHAYQVCTAFDALLTRAAGLGLVAGTLHARAALALLERLAQATPFQPQRDPQARLDVLGLLEAEGGRWDGVWVLGLSDEVLPASPRPNPLLPLAVLRAAGAPRATPEREQAWAAERYRLLCASAPAVIFSHPATEGERGLRPAPLIAHLPLAGPLTEIMPATRTAQCAAACFETLEDALGLPLSPQRPEHQAATEPIHTGGIDLLDTQARNPLWAYVRHRLGARALDDYAEPATASARGQFLHAALETLWRVLPDQAALHHAQAQARLEALLEAAIAQAAERTLAAWPTGLRDLECARARDVLTRCLQTEAARAPFAIAALEHELHWQHGPLALRLRIDRIDRLADGRLVVIDYKTGTRLANPLTDWLRARPIGLQLPVYATLAGELGGNETGDGAIGDSVAGLFLAHIHARDTLGAGLADGEIGVAGVTHVAALAEATNKAAARPGPEQWPAPSWPGILAHWQRALHSLADEYCAGVAHKVSAQASDLAYCDALPFLRLFELEAQQA